MLRSPSALFLALCACGGASGGGGGSGDASPSKGDDASEAGADAAPSSTCAEAGEAFPAAWNAGGPACEGEPAFQVHAYDEDTYVLRQSLCTSFEGPFLYLLFGEDRVLLEDTGDGDVPVREAVDGVIDTWLSQRGRASIELVVVNSHAHGDHVANNAAFESRPDTTVVGFSAGEIADYFGIGSWPAESASFDLGGRVVDVIPIPGHEENHIALFDRSRGLLLTGDTLYPGRLYIDDFPAYASSVDRLVSFTADRETCWVLGTHIEMTTTAGEDYDFGATHHPDEHVLQLGRPHLLELQSALAAMADSPHLEVHDDFIVYPLD